MIVSLLSIAENFSLNWIFTRYLGLGHRGLAMSTCLVALTDFVLALLHDAALRRLARNGHDAEDDRQSYWPRVRGSAAVCWAAVEFYLGTGSHLGNLQKLIGVLATVGVGAAVFFGAAYLLQSRRTARCGDAGAPKAEALARTPRSLFCPEPRRRRRTSQS